MICWDTTKSEGKLIGVSEIDLEENWDTTESVGVFGRGTKCCRLSTILPVGTAIKFPILVYLFGGLRRADIRSADKWDRSGDLPRFILEARIGP